MRRIVAYSTLPREGPSVRPRVLSYGPALEGAGIDLELRPFLTSRGFRGFYSRRPLDRARKVLASALGYARREIQFLCVKDADAALVHREIVPRGNGRALKALRRHRLPFAYDLDDAIYLSPREYVGKGELSHRRMASFKDPREVDALIRAADLVLAGNETIAEHALRLNRDVRVQPTPVDTERFRPRSRPERPRPLVGWVGSPTAAYCLKEIVPALARTAREVPFDLLVVGAGEEVTVPGVKVLGKGWSLAEEPFDFSSLDVGLYPLPDNEWTRGKCGMKALQYLASGVPTIASPVGVNRSIVSDGRTGLFARTPDEWTESLLTYLRDPDLRAAHASAGRRAVEERWSLAALSGGFVAAMKDLLP